MSTIKGTVYRYGSQERIAGASVKAIGPKGQIEYTKTDDDGDFEVDAPDPGKWSFMAFDENSFPGKSVEHDPAADGEVKIELRRKELLSAVAAITTELDTVRSLPVGHCSLATMEFH